MKKFIAALIFVCIFSGANAALADPVDDLLAYYVGEYGIEKGEIIVDDLPDDTGYFGDIYMSLTGLVVEGFRISGITLRMRGVQFNPPSEWKAGNVECKSALSLQAIAEIFEDDVNNAIAKRTFGDDGSEWHDMSMKITPEGLSGRGYYRFGFLDILIEATSKLRVVKNKELWLKDPQIKVNRMEVPDYVTKKALGDIQPILDLNRIPLPLSLHKIELRNGSAVLSSRTLPQPLTDGLTYTYTK